MKMTYSNRTNQIASVHQSRDTRTECRSCCSGSKSVIWMVRRRRKTKKGHTHPISQCSYQLERSFSGRLKKSSVSDIPPTKIVFAYSLGSRKRVQNFGGKNIAVEPEIGQNTALETALIAIG